MKRLILLIVGAIIIGKLFVETVVRLSRAQPTRGPHFAFAKALDEQMRLGPLADANESGAAPVATSPVQKSWTMKVSALPFNIKPPKKVEKKIVAKVDPKKEAEKKEEERRKERRKKLEEQAAKAKPSTSVPSVAPVAPPPPVAQPFQPTPVAGPGLRPTQTGPASVDNGNQNPVVAPTSYGGGGNSNGATSASLQSWIKLLVNSPTNSLMQSFVSKYKNQPQAFYEVLDAMEKSQVTLARQYAVQAAAMFSNVQSFIILADESATETDANVKSLAAQELSSYSNSNQLNTLSGALSSGDVNAEVAAASMIKTIVAGFGSGKSAPTATVAQELTSMLPVLTQLAAASNTSVPTLQADASAALQAIDSLLGLSAGTQPA